MNRHKFYKGRALDKELRTLYEERGKLPDMTRLEHEYHRRTTRILLGLVILFAVLTAASWGGFFLYGPRTGGGKEVELKIDAPEAVVSGVPQTITVRYKNTDRNPLALATLVLRPSGNLIITGGIPESTETGQLRWNLGTLEAHASGEIQIKLIPYGIVDTPLNLQALLYYKPANFNAEFQATQSQEFIVRAEGVAAKWLGPETALPGRVVELQAEIENHTDMPLASLQARLEAPGGFILQETEPKISGTGWEIGTLEPGKKYPLVIKGIFASTATGDQRLILHLAQRADKQTLPLSQNALTLVVEGSDLAVELLANNTPGLTWVRLNQPLQYLLKITNTADQTLEGLTAELALTSDLIDWPTVKAAEGNIQKPVVHFPAQGTFALAPKQTREFSVALNLVSVAPTSASPFILSQSKIQLADALFTSAPVRLAVASDLALFSQARYFGADGKPIGSGPLPPEVDKETTYELRWRLHNTFHDLSGITVSAALPAGVRFLGHPTVSGGKLSFQETVREVRWSIPRLPVTTPELTATFKIGVTPKPTDQGQLLGLLSVSRVEALDTITQTPFSADAPSVSSNLDADPVGQGKGVVQ